MSSISLVIPAFNEKNNIVPFYTRCEEVLKTELSTELSSGGFSHDFNYVFIDDGSSDGTFDEIKKIAAANPRVHGIRFSRNFGKEAGILAGLRSSSGDYTVIIDADLQQNPKYVLEMANFLDSNPDYDCVACYQKDRKEGPVMKGMKKVFYKVMDETSDTRFVEDASDFRMMRREMVEAVLQLGEYHRFSKGIFSWVGFNTYYMPYDVEDRYSGETSWSIRKLAKYAVDGVIGFSTTPLRLSTWLGGITSLAALIFLIYNVIKVLVFGKDVPGYATIVCLILIVGGVQMVLLGIMGEYISRIFIESKHRPIYIIKEEYQIPQESEEIHELAEEEVAIMDDESEEESRDIVFKWEKF